METATPLAAPAGGGVASVTSSPGARATEFLGFSACSVANAASEAEPSSASGRFAFFWLSARVRLSREWQTIWETSGGRTSRRPPAAQVSARPPASFLLPWSSPLLPCGSRGGLPGGGARSLGSTGRRGNWGGTTPCHTWNERDPVVACQSERAPSCALIFLEF